MEANKPENPPAFPAMDMIFRHGVDRLELIYEGMTLRDYFAAKAMSAIVPQMFFSVEGSHRYLVNDNHPHWPTIAADAYAMADAMLAERSKDAIK